MKENQQYTIYLDDLFGGEERDFVVEVDIPKLNAPSGTSFLHFLFSSNCYNLNIYIFNRKHQFDDYQSKLF